ncbi:MAG: metallo-beta-lactamase superfamily protein [Microbacteriaceae bacterium]|nr:metallo-beta-lactamase superfamily protein [Microbacteriaceae bacterium]
MIPTSPYRVLALKYGSFDRDSRQNFLDGDGEHRDMPMDFFTWVVLGNGHTIMVDTGYAGSPSTDRGRRVSREVEATLSTVGIAPEDVDHVVITHLHFDHAGNNGLFPNATYHLQRTEMEFATSPAMRHPQVSLPYVVDDVAAMIDLLFAGRLDLHDGDAEILPGIRLVRLGGHSPGSQMVLVQTERGTVALIGDVAHYYANIEQRRPFPTLVDVPGTYSAYERILDEVNDLEHVIPGHDPLVLERYPAVSDELAGWAAWLHIPPTGTP